MPYQLQLHLTPATSLAIHALRNGFFTVILFTTSRLSR
jgi:hypothetical protein